jgi:hypothetical protein
MLGSAVTYYQPATAWRGFEPCCSADLHSRAQEYAGEDHQVLILSVILGQTADQK